MIEVERSDESQSCRALAGELQDHINGLLAEQCLGVTIRWGDAADACTFLYEVAPDDAELDAAIGSWAPP